MTADDIIPRRRGPPPRENPGRTCRTGEA